MRTTFLNVQQTYELIKSQHEVTIIDVRTAEEFEMSYIESALNFDVKGAFFKHQIAELSRSSKYILHCHTGQRSREALKIFDSLGFDHIYHMDGGMREWAHAELPTVYNWFI